MLDIITREEIESRIYEALNIRLNDKGFGDNFEETVQVYVQEQAVRHGFYVCFNYRVDDNKSIELTYRNIKTLEDLENAIYNFDYIVTLVRQ